MNEIEFRNWMKENNVKDKVISDCVSRLKRIEQECNHCDLDKEYRSDRCEFLLGAFEKMGINDNMKKYSNANFLIGKYHMSTYRYSLKKYIAFCDQVSISKQK